jgi:hypothetical protein
MNRIVVLVCGLLILFGCKPANDVDFQQIEKTGILPGVAQLRLNEDGSVTLVHENTFFPIMLDENNQSAERVTLKPGGQCAVGDGRHASWQYQFQSADGDKVLLKVTGRFNAVSFGGGISEKSRKIRVGVYSRDKKSNQSEVEP